MRTVLGAALFVLLAIAVAGCARPAEPSSPATTAAASTACVPGQACRTATMGITIGAEGDWDVDVPIPGWKRIDWCVPASDWLVATPQVQASASLEQGPNGTLLRLSGAGPLTLNVTPESRGASCAVAPPSWPQPGRHEEALTRTRAAPTSVLWTFTFHDGACRFDGDFGARPAEPGWFVMGGDVHDSCA